MVSKVSPDRQFVSVVLYRLKQICQLISHLLMLVKDTLLKKMATFGFGKETAGSMSVKSLAQKVQLVQ
jgi:hypothetical protein